jgi:Transglycosylase SLT domain
MQQFRPIPLFQQVDDVDMIEAEQVVGNVSAPQPGLASPHSVISDRIAEIATQPHAAISGITPKKTGALSLTDALRSTMSTKANGRRVVIPGSKKRKTATHGSAPRMSRRLRHALILSASLVITFLTLMSLSPLSNGQIRLPVFSAIGDWVHAQQLSWEIAAHTSALSPAAPVQNTNLLPSSIILPRSQYVAIAQQDAMAVGIPPSYFVQQINTESGFDPNAVSPAGAVGIAQFLPSTAAGLGINPWDPIQALQGAAKMMAGYASQYGGDYAKALAAYNAGTGTVQNAVNNCGANWLNCIPGQTRNYIFKIMGI